MKKERGPYTRQDHVYSQQEDVFVTHLCTWPKYLQGKGRSLTGMETGRNDFPSLQGKLEKCSLWTGNYHYEKGENRIVQ